MKRHMKNCLAVALLAGACAQATFNKLPPAPPPQSRLSLAEIAGHWSVRALAEQRDTVLTTYQLWTSTDTAAWKLKFDNRADTIRVHVLAVAGDSILIRTGPYPSALRRDVTVTTNTVLRMRDGKLFGRSVARYSVTSADSVLRVRTEGTRVR